MAILAKKIQPSKAQAIEEAKKVLSEYKDFIFVEYRGLTVDEMTEDDSLTFEAISFTTSFFLSIILLFAISHLPRLMYQIKALLKQ